MTSRRPSLSVLLLVALALPLLARCATTPVEEPQCRVILVVPPYHWDEVTSNEIMDEWISAARMGMGPCDSFVPRRQTVSQLEFLRMSHLYYVRPRHVRSHAETLAEAFGATHAVVLNVTWKKMAARVAPVLMSLRSKTIQTDLTLTQPRLVTITRPDLVQPSWQRQVAVFALGFLPTSIAGGIGTQPSDFLEESRHVRLSRETHSSLPEFLSSIHATSPIHPDEMSLFDFVPRLTGSTSLLSRDETHRYRTTVTGDPDSLGDGVGSDNDAIAIYSMKLFVLAPTAGGEISLHTPIGTTSLGAEFGLAFAWASTSQDPSRFLFPGLTKYTLAHRVFLVDRLFLEFASTTLEFSDPLIDDEYMTMGRHTHTSLSLGFFFPETRSWIRHAAM